MIHYLPAELVLRVVGFVDFKTLMALRTTCHYLFEFISYHSETIFRVICFPKLTTERTCSASGIEATLFTLPFLSKVYDPDELRRVLIAQRSMDTCYDGVHTWTEFARRRIAIDRNWYQGKATARWIIFDEPRNWRFKLDPESRTIVTSRVEGGFSVFNRDGEILRSTRWPGEYPHIELSEGYLVVTEGDIGFMCYRKASITSPPAPLTPEHSAMLVARLTHRLNNDSPEGYLPFNILSAGFSFSSLKIRFPLLCAISIAQRVVTLWNLNDGSATPCTTISIESLWHSNVVDQPATYVDFDADFIYLTGTREVTVWSIHTGECVGALPVPYSGGEAYYPNWLAVHHDPLGKSVIAINENGQLVWTPRFIEREDGFVVGMDQLEKTVVLRLQSTISMGQLCVENGRAVFSTLSTTSARQTLWLLILDDFEDHDDFICNPPRLICISPLLPNMAPVSRLEMTGDEIFVTAQSTFAPGATDYEWHLTASLDINPLNLLHSWCTIQNEILIDLRDTGDGGGVNGAGATNWWSPQLDNTDMDAVLAFSFAGSL